MRTTLERLHSKVLQAGRLEQEIQSIGRHLKKEIQAGNTTGDMLQDYMIRRGSIPFQSSYEQALAKLRERLQPMTERMGAGKPLLIVQKHIEPRQDSGCVRVPFGSETCYYHAALLAGDALQFTPAQGYLDFPTENGYRSSERQPRSLLRMAMKTADASPGQLYFLELFDRCNNRPSGLLYHRDHEAWEAHVGIDTIVTYCRTLYGSRRDELVALLERTCGSDIRVALEITRA